VVIHHGDGPWKSSTELLDLYDLAPDVREAIAEYLPRLRLILDDLNLLSEDEIRHRAPLTMGARLVQGLLRILRSSRDPKASLQGWWKLAASVEAEPDGVSVIRAVAYYVCEVVPAELHPEVFAIMQENVSEAGRSVVRTIADSLREEGEARGKARGEAHGLARAVVGVFEARGIPISDDARDRIMACQDINQLERWHRRAVVANSVGEIFEV
jgi:hypothetical protein